MRVHLNLLSRVGVSKADTSDIPFSTKMVLVTGVFTAFAAFISAKEGIEEPEA